MIQIPTFANILKIRDLNPSQITDTQYINALKEDADFLSKIPAERITPKMIDTAIDQDGRKVIDILGSKLTEKNLERIVFNWGPYIGHIKKKLGKNVITQNIVDSFMKGRYGVALSTWTKIPSKFRTKELLTQIVNTPSYDFHGNKIKGPDHTELFTKTDWKKFNS